MAEIPPVHVGYLILSFSLPSLLINSHHALKLEEGNAADEIDMTSEKCVTSFINNDMSTQVSC